MTESEESTLREELFWQLAEPMLVTGEAEESTMMGLKCLRYQGQFFASLDRNSKSLIVKLPKDRVAELISQERAVAFAPNGRRFKEWAMIPEANESFWLTMLEEAKLFVSS